MSLLDTARNWTLFSEALGPSCDLAEKEFKRLTVPARLERVVAVAGMDPLVAEINATLLRLKVGYDDYWDVHRKVRRLCTRTR